MGCADLLEPVTHYPVGEFRFVAFTAEVGEIKMVQVGGHDLRDGFSSIVVGEMAVAAENSLFQTPGSARGILKHFDIMVGFKNKNVRGACTFNDKLGHVSEVGDKTKIAGAGAQ